MNFLVSVLEGFLNFANFAKYEYSYFFSKTKRLPLIFYSSSIKTKSLSNSNP